MTRPFPELHPKRVTVLCADRAALAHESRATVYQSWLNHAEQVRLQQFRRTADAELFLLGRALLRSSLARLIGVPPADVALRIDAHGKPACPALRERAFNLSHSGGMVVLAIAPTAAVGVDIEAIDRTLDWASVASDHFAQTELADIAALPTEAQSGRFYRYWTLKEAYGKAQGRGIVSDLRRMGFSAVSGHRYQSQQSDDHRREFLWAAQLRNHHALALAAIGGEVESVEIWRSVPQWEIERLKIPMTAQPAELYWERDNLAGEPDS